MFLQRKLPSHLAVCYDVRVNASLASLSPPVALRKPMAKASRVTLFEREVRERLSQPALEILLDSAEVLSEGQRVDALHGGESVYGSAMLTIDLAKVSGRVRETCDEAAAQRVAGEMATDQRVGARLRELAAQAARRLAGSPVDNLATEVRVRARGSSIYIDIDFEGDA